MGPIEILLGVAFPLLLTGGLAFAMSGSTSPEFLVARICFVLSAIDLAGLVIWWLYVTVNSSWKTAIAAALAVLLVTGLPATLRWIDGKEVDAIAQRKSRLVQETDQISPLIGAMRQQQSSLAGQEEARKLIERILGQYESRQAFLSLAFPG
jgi:hypothetical protein